MPSTENLYTVGSAGGQIIALIDPFIPSYFTKDQALNLAAYLVAIADPLGTEFQKVLKAIQET